MASRALRVVSLLEEREKVARRPLVIVETGSIRNPALAYHNGDGHSTKYIAEFLRYRAKYAHVFYSIDLDTSVAKTYLASFSLDKYVRFLEGDSVHWLRLLRMVDFAYLDSANNGQTILAEFRTLENRLNSGAIVVVDDVDLLSPELRKGDLVVPYARERYEVEMSKRQAVIRI